VPNENLISEILVLVKRGDQWEVLVTEHILVENEDDIKSAVGEYAL
jgi:hypothetical protein